MPATPQEPLSPLVLSGQIRMKHTELPPQNSGIELENQIATYGGTMMYFGNHVWSWNGTVQARDWDDMFFYYREVVVNIQINCSIALNWNNNSLDLTCGVDASQAFHLPDSFHNRADLKCEQGHPWSMPWTEVTAVSGPNEIKWAIQRDVSVLAALLPMFASSPTVFGRCDGGIIHQQPVYRPEHIQGINPPDAHTTKMRRNADGRIHTDLAHVQRTSAFSSAAEQWAALSQTDRDAWCAAGMALRPRIPGYALWTRIITAKRLDQIPALAARAGVTLVPPSLDT